MIVGLLRGGSRAAATSKMDCFVIIVNGFQPLTIITKPSILDVAAVLGPTLVSAYDVASLRRQRLAPYLILCFSILFLCKGFFCTY